MGLEKKTNQFIRTSAAIILLVCAAPTLALSGDKLIVRDSQAICGELLTANIVANSQADRVAALGKIFSEDFPIFQSRSFRILSLRAFGDLERNGPQIRSQLEALQENRAANEANLKQASVKVKGWIDWNFDGQLKDQVMKSYHLDEKEFLAVQDILKTVNAEPALKEAMETLVGEVIFYSTDNLLKSLVIENTGKYLKDEFVWLQLPFAPKSYCYLGNCIALRFTKQKLTTKALNSAVASGYVQNRSAFSEMGRDRKSFSAIEIRKKLKEVPHESSLDVYEGVLRYDREIRRNFHELGLKGIADHSRFTNQTTWDGFATMMKDAKKNAEPAEFAARVHGIEDHIVGFQDDMKTQLLGVVQTQETVTLMQGHVQTKLESLEGASTPTGELEKKELRSLSIRLDSLLTESVGMGESIENWLVRSETALETLASANSNGVLKNIAQIEKDLGVVGK